MASVHNFGEFETIADAWAIYPNGGGDGDYITVGGVEKEWDNTSRTWGGNEDIPGVSDIVIIDTPHTFTEEISFLGGITVGIYLENETGAAIHPSGDAEFRNTKVDSLSIKDGGTYISLAEYISNLRTEASNDWTTIENLATPPDNLKILIYDTVNDKKYYSTILQLKKLFEYSGTVGNLPNNVVYADAQSTTHTLTIGEEAYGGKVLSIVEDNGLFNLLIGYTLPDSNYEDAVTACNDLISGLHSDWRLSTWYDLQEIVNGDNYSRTSLFVNQPAYLGLNYQTGNWSANSWTGNPNIPEGYATVVRFFQGGNPRITLKTDIYNVLAIRDETVSTLTVQGDSVITVIEGELPEYANTSGTKIRSSHKRVDDLLPDALTGTIEIQYWEETLQVPDDGKYWYDTSHKQLYQTQIINGLHLANPLPYIPKDKIYRYKLNTYRWNGSDMVPLTADLNSEQLVTLYNTPTIYAIGDSAFGGKIAYILQEGDPGYDANIQKGLVAYPTDLPAARWSNVIETIPVLSDEIGAGKTNSDTIISLSAYQEGLPDGTNYTPKICEALGEGWFLPSLNELKKFKANKALIGGFQTEIVGGNADAVTYWSSSYGTGKKAILFDESNTEISSATNPNYLIRACKYFTNEIPAIRDGEIIVSAGGKEVKGSGKTMEELIASIPSGETLHSHANKDILDAIQESFTTSLKTAYNSAVTASHTHTVDFLQIVNTIPFVCSDETTDITASTTVPKKRFVFQTAQSFTKIVGELNVAAVGGTFTVDVKKNGTTTFSTLLTFDSGENTTRTASAPFVLATSPLVFGIGDYVEIFVTGIGSVTAGKGLTIYFM